MERPQRREVDVGERVAGDHQERVAEELGDVADATSGAEQLVLVAVGELEPEARAIAEVDRGSLREPMEVGDSLGRTRGGGSRRDDVLHHRAVEDQDQGFGIP